MANPTYAQGTLTFSAAVIQQLGEQPLQQMLQAMVNVRCDYGLTDIYPDQEPRTFAFSAIGRNGMLNTVDLIFQPAFYTARPLSQAAQQTITALQHIPGDLGCLEFADEDCGDATLCDVSCYLFYDQATHQISHYCGDIHYEDDCVANYYQLFEQKYALPQDPPLQLVQLTDYTKFAAWCQAHPVPKLTEQQRQALWRKLHSDDYFRGYWLANGDCELRLEDLVDEVKFA